MCLSADLAVIPAWMRLPGTHLADDPEKPNRQHIMSCLPFCPKGSLALVWLGSGSLELCHALGLRSELWGLQETGTGEVL